MSYTMKKKILFTTVAVVAVFLAAFAVAAFMFFRTQFKTTVSNDQRLLVDTVAEELDHRIEYAQSQLAELAREFPPDALRGGEKAAAYLESHPLQFFGNGLMYYSLNGDLEAISPRQPDVLGKNFAFRPYFYNTIRTGHGYVSGAFQSMQAHRHPIIMFTEPVKDRSGTIRGVLGGSVDLQGDNIFGKLATLRIGRNGYFYLFSRDRTMIVHPDKSRILKQDIPAGGNRLLDAAIDVASISGETVNTRGIPMLASFRQLQRADWVVAATSPLNETYLPIVQAGRYSAGWAVFLLFVAGGVIHFFTIRLTRPLHDFAAHVEHITDQGTLDPVEIARRDEVGVLAKRFNRLLQQLREQQQALEEERSFAVKLVMSSAVPTFVLDGNGVVVTWNHAMQELTGVPSGEIIGTRDAWRPFYPESRSVLADFVLQGKVQDVPQHYLDCTPSPLTPEGVQAEGWFRNLNGSDRYIFFDAAPVRDSSGRIMAVVQSMQDITARKQAEERLHAVAKELRRSLDHLTESEERYRGVVELSPDGIMIIEGSSITFLNAAGRRMLQCESGDLLLSSLLPPEGLLAGLIERVGEGEGFPWTESCLLRRDGTAVEVEAVGTVLSFSGRQAVQVIFRDITERNATRRTLEYLAHYDTLTDLPNRALFYDRLKLAIAEAQRYGSLFALLYLDLDGFKEVNDTIGHDGGDIVLREAGRRLKESIRACDIAARMGGDEFTVILGRVDSEDDVFVVCDRITQAFAEPIEVKGEICRIGASIGSAVFGRDGNDCEALLACADSGMYETKRRQKGEQQHASAAVSLTGADDASSPVCPCPTGSLLPTILNAIPAPIFFKDLNGVYQGCNSFFESFIGLPTDDIVGRTAFDIAPHELAEVYHRADLDLIGAGGIQVYETSVRYADGSLREVMFHKAVYSDADGQTAGLVGTMLDITERKKAEAEARYLAHYDRLTDLPNMTLFLDRLRLHVSHADRHNETAAVFILEMENVRTLANVTGASATHQVVRIAAERLRALVRQEDTVARIGDTSFAFILPWVGSPEAAGSLAMKLVGAVETPVLLDEGTEVMVTSSIGICLFPQDGKDADALLANATIAALEARELRSGAYSFYSSRMNAFAQELVEVRGGLHHGLQRGEFVLYYQPQIDAATGAVTGAEALVRWHHPEKGLIPPGVFIPVAEKTGLIVQLGEWVMAEAARQAKEWEDAGTPLSVSVNLSPRQLRQPDLYDRLVRAIEVSGVTPELIGIEITESALMENLEEGIEVLGRLKEYGLHVSLDDFGTGYSSLAYLKKFPLDVVKIDRTFVFGLPGSTDDVAIVSAVIAMATTLGLRVVAEGVETAEQAMYLSSSGCSGLQGFYYGKPCAADEFTTFFIAERRRRDPELWHI